ncbi:MAG: hypothetical protein CL911_06260 [Deltaproteobacteria bacterium]|nr:hypothetical protein [Deltaproteobacteria bacterium]
MDYLSRLASRCVQAQRPNLWLFLAMLLVCYGLSAYMRLAQFEIWKQNPQAYFVGERPMMTTLDAPYWLRLGREYQEGTSGRDKFRFYPDNSESLNKRLAPPSEFQDQRPQPAATDEVGIRDVPLLSVLSGTLAATLDGNHYLAGTLLVPMLAGLFIIPLGIYFYLIGVPAAGLLGALIGNFCAEYYMRASIGRIDTDMLNLFFPALGGLLVLLAGKATSLRNRVLFSALAGLALHGFDWWYEKPGFTLAYFCVLLAMLAIHRTPLRTLLLCSIVFVVVVGPDHFRGGVGSISSNLFARYLNVGQEVVVEVADGASAPAAFPNVYKTISEAERVPVGEVLTQVLDSEVLGWLGFVSFGLFALLQWRCVIPLLPFLALGVFGFYSSRRFIMFLAPFVGVGLGLFATLVVQYAWSGMKSLTGPSPAEQNSSKSNTKQEPGQKTGIWHNPLFREVLVYGAVGLCFLGIYKNTAFSFVPGPSIPTAVYATFMEVKKRVPPDAVIVTWWDYGYALMDATGLATFHDGGVQTSPKTYFVARSLITPSSKDLYRITKFLATEGNPGITAANTSPERLLQAVHNPTRTPEPPIYLFFTYDMIGKYIAFSNLGSHDLAKGSSRPKGFQKIACQSLANDMLTCNQYRIDLKQGRINDRFPVKRTVQVLEGKVVHEQEYPNAQGITVQFHLQQPSQISEVYLLEEEVFASNFNQMYLLGRYDASRFEEVLNAFPLSRLYRFRFGEANPPTE